MAEQVDTAGLIAADVNRLDKELKALALRAKAFARERGPNATLAFLDIEGAEHRLFSAYSRLIQEDQ